MEGLDHVQVLVLAELISYARCELAIRMGIQGEPRGERRGDLGVGVVVGFVVNQQKWCVVDEEGVASGRH